MFTICLHFGHTLFTTVLYNVLKDKGKGVLKESIKGICNMTIQSYNTHMFTIRMDVFDNKHITL